MAEALRRCATAGERSGKELHQEGAVYFDDISCMGLHAWLIYLIYICNSNSNQFKFRNTIFREVQHYFSGNFGKSYKGHPWTIISVECDNIRWQAKSCQESEISADFHRKLKLQLIW